MIRTFDGTAEVDALAQPVAQVADHGVAQLLELEKLDDLLGLRGELLFLAPGRTPMDQRAEQAGAHPVVEAGQDVLARRHARIGLDALEGARDADRGAPMRAQVPDVLPVERHRPELRAVKA
jgi:hypothetical protein